VTTLLPTTVVGSWVQPDWLVDRGNLGSRLPPRVRARELWRVAPEHLEEAQDAATLLAIDDMLRAGLDIVGDGEIRRESYSNRFATALEGVTIEPPGVAIDRTGHPNPVPRITSRIRRTRPVELRDGEVLVRAACRRAKTKITLPGPFTMVQQAQNDFYASEEEAAMDYADALREEIRDLFAAGVDVVQLDEPYVQARSEKARAYAVRAINRALDGAGGTTVVHLCFGYAHIVHERPSGYSFLPELDACNADVISIEAAQPNLDPSVLRALPSKTIMLGVVSLGDPEPETAEVVAARIRRAMEVVPAERLWIAPDCGMKYVRTREVAFAKLRAMVDGAALVRGDDRTALPSTA
jgi:5-methyltetrahydropteroyltriglutamate--homocysteine methyltransferase